MTRADDRSLLHAALAIVGAANAMIRPMAVSVEQHGLLAAAANGFGINLAVWLALVLAIAGLAATRGGPLRRVDLAVTAVMLCALMVPSSSASWLVLALLAAWIGRDRHLSVAQRAGVVVLFVVAIREPLLSSLIHLFNTQLLALDAILTSLALSPFVDGARADGNMVMAEDGVRLVVLSSCSSLANLSFAMLFWFSVSRTLMPRITPSAWRAGTAIGLLVVAQNVGRLAVMASSGERYDYLHGDIGRPLLEAAMLLSVILLTLWGVRHAIADLVGRGTAGASRPG